MDNVIAAHLTKHGYSRKNKYSRDNPEWYFVFPTITDKIKRDITLEQLMTDDLQSLIDKITNKYLSEDK